MSYNVSQQATKTARVRSLFADFSDRAVKVIIMGGGSPATNTSEVIDLAAATPAWQSGPNMSAGRIEMNAVILPDGRVLAVGGSVYDEDISTASARWRCPSRQIPGI